LRKRVYPDNRFWRKVHTKPRPGIGHAYITLRAHEGKTPYVVLSE